jgi:hypothetical protein
MQDEGNLDHFVWKREIVMERATIQDWTQTAVPLKFDDRREVCYRVYREGSRHFQEIRDTDDRPIHTLELPDGMKLDRTSYEVLLRYVLLDVVAA